MINEEDKDWKLTNAILTICNLGEEAHAIRLLAQHLENKDKQLQDKNAELLASLHTIKKISKDKTIKALCEEE